MVEVVIDVEGLGFVGVGVMVIGQMVVDKTTTSVTSDVVFWLRGQSFLSGGQPETVLTRVV